MLGWLSKESIPERTNVCISLPNDENWQADFRGAILALSKAENWEEYGALTSEEMADEWRAIFFEFLGGTCSMIPVATILEYAGATLPDGFFWADGSTFVRADFPLLFAEIGTTFGAGNGTTTANLPDKRGRVGVGLDTLIPDFDALGNDGGEKDHTLTLAESASHGHTQNAHGHTQNAHGHTQNAHGHTQNEHDHVVFGNAIGVAGTASRVPTLVSGSSNTISQGTIATNQTTVAVNQTTVAVNQTTVAVNQAAGGGLPHNNMPPFLVCNYIIKY